MNKTILMIILAVMSSSAMAEWVEVGSSYIDYASMKTTAYADPASIRKVGDIVKMRTRVDYKPVEMVDGKKQKTIIAKAISVAWSQGEYDCKNIQSREGSFEWTPVSPGSIDENCGNLRVVSAPNYHEPFPMRLSHR
jgi:hypothetical protein